MKVETPPYLVETQTALDQHRGATAGFVLADRHLLAERLGGIGMPVALHPFAKNGFGRCDEATRNEFRVERRASAVPQEVSDRLPVPCAPTQFLGLEKSA